MAEGLLYVLSCRAAGFFAVAAVLQCCFKAAGLLVFVKEYSSPTQGGVRFAL